MTVMTLAGTNRSGKAGRLKDDTFADNVLVAFCTWLFLRH